MTKIRSFYKPVIGLIILAMLLLFTQAMCDLKLPDYMSDIVNIGIQSSGIEDEFPKAISVDSLNVMHFFMLDSEIELINNNYTKISIGNADYINKYPLLKDKDIYILNDNVSEDDLNKISDSFKIATQTMITFAKDYLANTARNSRFESEQNKFTSINSTMVHSFAGLIDQIPKENIEYAREETIKSIDISSTQVSNAFTKMFYEELGMDIAEIQRNYIIKVGLKMLAVCALGIISAILVGFIASRVGAGFARNLRKAIFEKVQSFSSKEFNEFNVASLITRTTNDVTVLQNSTVMAIRMLAYAPIMGIGALLMMVQKTNNMTWTIALGCFGILVIILILFFTVLPKIKKVQKLTDKINQVANEALSGIMVIRAFGTQEHEEKRFDDININVMKTNRFINRMLGVMMPSMFLVMDLLTVLILWVGANQISESTIQIGDLMAVMQYGMEVMFSFLFVAVIFVILPRAAVSAGRIREILEKKNSIVDPEISKDFDNSKIGVVEFKNVDFSYPMADEKVLENINFVAEPGKTTAIIGATGSGKSTIVNLIPRIFDVTSGEVLVNGVNVKDINLSKLTSQIGYVPQKGNRLS